MLLARNGTKDCPLSSKCLQIGKRERSRAKSGRRNFIPFSIILLKFRNFRKYFLRTKSNRNPRDSVMRWRSSVHSLSSNREVQRRWRGLMTAAQRLGWAGPALVLVALILLLNTSLKFVGPSLDGQQIIKNTTATATATATAATVTYYYSTARLDQSGSTIHDMLLAHAYAHRAGGVYGGACVRLLPYYPRRDCVRLLRSMGWRAAALCLSCQPQPASPRGSRARRNVPQFGRGALHARVENILFRTSSSNAKEESYSEQYSRRFGLFHSCPYPSWRRESLPLSEALPVQQSLPTPH